MDNKFVNYYEENISNLDYRKIGIRIKTLRKKLKLTQQQLADKIFKTESSIRKYEKGLVPFPMNVLIDLSNALDTTVSYLLCLDESGADNVYSLVSDYNVPPWEMLGIKDASTFLANTSVPELYKEYINKLGGDYVKIYISNASKEKTKNDYRESSIQRLIDKFQILLSGVGYTLSELKNDKYKLSPDDGRDDIVITREELFNLWENVMGYTSFTVNNFYDKLNNDEHKPPKGQIFFHA